MAHRIYIYNIDSSTGEDYSNDLGEWNYVLPPLLLPLFGSETRAKGAMLYADRKGGIAILKQFYDLLADEYQLHENKNYYEPVNQMFSFLEDLPFDTFLIDGSDVFMMNDDKPRQQAKDWVLEIKEQIKLYRSAIESHSLTPLQELLASFGYKTFLQALETDWVNYGLGYWHEDHYKNHYAEAFEENKLKGLKDSKGNIITAAIYDEIFEFEDGVAVIQKGNKFGYINTLGTELVTPIYDNAFDIFDIYYGTVTDYNYEFTKKVGIVSQDNKFGLLLIAENRTLIPVEYDELTYIFGNYFNAKKEKKRLLINHQNKIIIDQESEIPFEFESPELFFLQIGGSSKRKYFTISGIYLGDYIEDSLESLSHDYFYLKANKRQKKITIIRPDGSLLETEIDQIIRLSNYQSFAYRKAGQWFLFDTQHHQFLLSEIEIQKVIIDYLANYFQDIYIIETPQAKGIFDANQGLWLLQPDIQYLKIEHQVDQYLRVQLKKGMRYWDGKTNQLSALYDYVSEAINLESNKLFLYQHDELYCFQHNGEIRKIADNEIGLLQHRKYSLQGKDLAQFSIYYEHWKTRVGPNYLQHFDDVTLFQMGLQCNRENNIDEAIRVFTLGAARNHPEMTTELANIYTDTEDQLHANLPLGIQLYEKAAVLGEKVAWNNLGYHYQNGIGCDQNTSKAIEAYTKAGELRHGLGWANLGDLYYYGELVDEDYDKALDYYLKAQKLHYYNDDKIADIYFTRQDYKKALPLLKKDYDEEFSPIYYGILYEQGLGGLKVNLTKAISYYEKAMAINNYPHAISQLLFHYRVASDLANKDQFDKWFAFAKENNLTLDLELLGIAQTDNGSFFKKLFKKKD